MKHRGATFDWKLTVRGITPLGWRLFVELQVHPTLSVTQCVIQGALPVDSSPLSVRTPQMLSWLEKAGPYPARWPKPPFPIKEKSLPKGFSVRLKLAKSVDDDLMEAFRSKVAGWGSTMVPFQSEDHPCIRRLSQVRSKKFQIRPC